MQSHPRFPLSDFARIEVALYVMKCELPFRINALPAAKNLRLADTLPPSSPVLKKGFEPDARDWLRVLNHIESPVSRDDIKTLSRIRDLWAHQQDMKSGDGTRFCETAADLMSDLDAPEVSRVLSTLAAPPPLPPSLHLERPVTSYREQCQVLSLDPDDDSDQRRYLKHLIWQAALAKITGTPTLAIVLQNDFSEDENALPPTLFNWAIGLSSDAPPQMVRASVRHSRALLDEHDEDAY